MTLAVLPEDHDRVYQALQECIDGKTRMFEVECRIRHHDEGVA